MARSNGVTLLELLTALGILILVTAMAVPPLKGWYDNHQTRRLQTQLLHSLRLARNEAVASGSRVTLCPAADGQCQGNWSQQLMAFIDIGGDGDRQAGDRLLLLSPLQPRGSLRWRSFRGKNYLQFDATGMTPALNGTLHYCPDEPGVAGFALTLSRTGRSRIRAPSC